MFKPAIAGLATGTFVTLAAVSTATADPIEFYSTTFDEFANNTYISGTNGWTGGSFLRTNQFWGSDDSRSVYGERSGSGFAGNYHTLATNGAAVEQRFQISFDMVVRLLDKAAFDYAGMFLSHTLNPADNNGRWATGPVRLARDAGDPTDPNDDTIRINYWDENNQQVFVGPDLSDQLYAASNEGYYYTFTLDVNPAQRTYDLVVTQTKESTETETPIELHRVTGLPFREGTHTSLTSFEFGLSNATAASSGNNRIFVDNIRIVPIPEPGALSLMAIGGLMLRRQ